MRDAKDEKCASNAAHSKANHTTNRSIQRTRGPIPDTLQYLREFRDLVNNLVLAMVDLAKLYLARVPAMVT